MKSLILKAAKAAGKVILKDYGNVGNFKFKAPRSIVTKTDILSEQIIMKTVRKKFPNHNFLTEESGSIIRESEYTWIVDPIDGTTNFVSNIPQFAVSIALAKNDEVMMGVVYNPCTKDLFIAEKGKGSYLNGKRLHVSKKNNLKDGVLAFSLPSDTKLARKSLSFLDRSFGTFRALRNFGSAALNMCYIAQTKFDMYYSFNIKAWDIAAANLIVEEAGGKVSNINNKKWKLDDDTIVASNKTLHNKFIELLR